jgi:hypothetical protein
MFLSKLKQHYRCSNAENVVKRTKVRDAESITEKSFGEVLQLVDNVPNGYPQNPDSGATPIADNEVCLRSGRHSSKCCDNSYDRSKRMRFCTTPLERFIPRW